MSGAMGAHHSTSNGSNVWLTPQGIIRALGTFDLDPCAAPDNPDQPRPWPTATRHIAPPEDGLSVDWGDARVWLNPPYTEAERWLRALADHGRGIALMFARTETRWFIDCVWRRASAVLFLHGRLHFHLPDGSRARGNAGAPSCLIAYGNRDAELLAASELPGTFVSGWVGAA